MNAKVCTDVSKNFKNLIHLLSASGAIQDHHGCLFFPYTLCILLGFHSSLSQFGLAGWFTGYTLGCQMVDYSTSPKALRVCD